MTHHARMAMLLASTIIGTFSANPVAMAQDATNVLEEIVIKSDEGDAELSGATVETITSDELEERQIESLSDLSKLDPSVDFNEDNGSVNIRGLDGSRVLTTIDGVPVPWMYEPVYGTSGGVSTFGFDTLSQVDILKGSDSSRYGSGVLGGMLGLRTINPSDIIKDGKTWGGQSKVTYDSADNSVSASQAAAVQVGGTSVLLQGGYKFGHETTNKGDIGGSGTTRTEANPADYDQYNILGKIFHEFGEGHRVGVIGEHFYLKDDVDVQTSISSTYSDYDLEETSERSRVSFQYDFTAQTENAFVDGAHILGYWQSMELNSDTNATRTGTLAGDYDRGDKISKDGLGAHTDFNKTLELFGLENRFLFAADGYWGETTQYTSGVDACDTVYSYSCYFYHVNQSYQPDVTSMTFGASLEDRIALGASGFSITPGVRFDWFSHDPNSTAAYEANDTSIQNLSENTDAAISGKLLAEYSWSFGRIYGQWAQGFRAPTADELFTTYGSQATYLTIGNPDLEAETSNGFELGIELGDSNFGGGAATFLNLYKNFIDTQSVTAASLGLSGYPYGVNQYINRDNVRIYGVEANVHWKFRENWKVSGSIAMIEGQDQSTGETISSVPPFRGIVDLGYDNGVWGVGATWTVAGSRDNVGLTEGYAPGYGLLDVRASWTPELVEGLILSASVDNVFDQTYYNAVSIPTSTLTQPNQYYSETGRSFKANLIYKF